VLQCVHIRHPCCLSHITRVAVSFSVLQCVSVCCSVIHTLLLLPLTCHTCCNVLQRVAVYTYLPVHIRHSCSLTRVAVCCSVLQRVHICHCSSLSHVTHVAVCCRVDTCTTIASLTCHTCCSVLQRPAVCTYTPVLLLLALAHEPLLYFWWPFACKCVRHLGRCRILDVVRGSGSYA